MRLFNTKVFDDTIYGPIVETTRSEYNAQLGLADHFSLFLISSANTIDVDRYLFVGVESSPDEQNWGPVTTWAFILHPGVSEPFEAFWATTTQGCSAYVRLSFLLYAPSGSTNIKAWVSGRADLKLQVDFS